MIVPQEIYHPLYEDKEKFIILITGWRGSGKSFNASAFIERLTFEMTPVEKIVHQILYTRYTMVSAGMSIIPEMMEKIDLDGTTKYFKTTKTDIVNKMTKSRIMFRGIKTSSGNQTAKLKSIQGITTFVCDEAEEWTSEDEFDKIMLSIRKKGIQNRIIIIMNPCDSNHFIYKKYIEKTHKLVEIDGVQVQISTHPNVLHIHTTYFDNLDNLSPEFLKEVEDMKVGNPEKYAHVVSAVGQTWRKVLCSRSGELLTSSRLGQRKLLSGKTSVIRMTRLLPFVVVSLITPFTWMKWITVLDCFLLTSSRLFARGV